MKRLLFALALICIAVAAIAVPLTPMPRPRPPEPQALEPMPSQPFIGSMDTPPDPAPPREPSVCQLRLSNVAKFAPLPDIIGLRGCGATDLVSLEAVLLPDKTEIPLKPAPMLRCTMADAVARWINEDVAGAVATLGSALREIDNYDSFDCRGRNRVASAKTSEHGMANAIDLRGFRLVNGTFAGLTDRALSREFRETIRKSVCARFSTILGPGSDGYHESHVHLDLAQRRNDYRICQWNVLDPVPEVPLPRPRPAEAPAAIPLPE